jgi:hypothetical protein
MIKEGDRFERLVVEKFERSHSSHQLWLCHCDCGKTTIARGDKLQSGRTKSCGCLKLQLRQALENKDLNDDNILQKTLRELKTCLQESKETLNLAQKLASKNFHLAATNKCPGLGVWDLVERAKLSGLHLPSDYTKFQKTGRAKEMATALRSWALLVSEVLEAGDDEFKIIISIEKVHI